LFWTVYKLIIKSIMWILWAFEREWVRSAVTYLPPFLFGFVPKPLKSPLHKKILPDLGKHLPELYKEGYSLEIHTRLFDETKYDEDFYNDIFNNAAEIKTDNIPALALPHDINLNYLIKHFNYHLQAGDCQLRLYNDIRLLHPVNKPEFPGEFILNPVQKGSKKFIREIYKTGFKSVPAHYRLRYLTGDIFPSLWWMKERYKCGTMAALLRYPARLGKLWWIVWGYRRQAKGYRFPLILNGGK